jgi:tetrahydromethanopterin S-methyltransferase subunit D
MPESAPDPEAAVAPEAPAGPAAIVGQVVGAAVEQVVRAVRPEAAVAVATEFTFPLVLALAVLAYLVIQGQIDRRDPKLRVAPQNVVETLVTFKTEEEL